MPESSRPEHFRSLENSKKRLMDSQTIRTALGRLQSDPDSEEAWRSLRESVLEPGGDLDSEQLVRLLEAAAGAHRGRGEWEAVSQIFEILSRAVAGTSGELAVVVEHARILNDELLDSEGSDVALLRVLELVPDHADATAALEENESKRAKCEELVQTYAGEAESAPDDVYRSSMLMRAAEVELRYGSGERASAAERLDQAARLDPSNERASWMLELVHRRAGRWKEAAAALNRAATRGENPEARVRSAVRLARLSRFRLEDKEGAARAYAQVLKDQPAHDEAREFLLEHFSDAERWDDLVALYEKDLASQDLTSAERLGDVFQIAMLHWRKREAPEDADPWFERVRKIEPAHEGMLNFFRQYLASIGDDARLLGVLQAAHRVMSEGPSKAEVGTEIARLAESQKDAQRAIEQYKGLLRQDPDNTEARDSLKRLYRQTEGYNALVELLRQQLERTPAEETAARLEILQEVAEVYRQFVKSDTALVSVLGQMAQLDDTNVDVVRELVELFERLGRWRDLLTQQQRLAELTEARDEKVELYRSVARRWLDQFSNVQHAIESFEKLYELAPDDQEANERLVDLYKKRRNWAGLYALYEKDLARVEGTARVELMSEMAKLAAERLNRGEDAVRLYREILEADPSAGGALDAIEKHAERAKDWATLAWVLEKRVEQASDDAASLAVLQKLGTVYADHLADHVSAARTWQRVLEIQPGHNRALRVLRDSYLEGGDYDALEQLYGAQGDWDGLADVFSTAADRAKDNDTKVALSYRAASVYEERLGQPDRAFRSYERVLATQPSDARAAGALIPLYEGDEKWARLPALYEVLLSQEEGTDERVALLRKLVEVTGSRLGDKRAAADYAKSAYEIAPGNEDALSLLEETARNAGAWEGFVDALQGRLRAEGKKKNKEWLAEKRRLRLKVASVYSEQLGKKEEAIEAYKALLEADAGDEDAARALEALLRTEGRVDDLRWLLELRVENASSDEERVRILADWATLEEEVFQDPARAAHTLRRVLELAPGDSGALRALPRLLTQAADHAGAAEVLEAHRDHAEGADRAQLEIELAEIYLVRLGRASDALEAAVRALESSEGDARAISVLERLLENSEARDRAAEILAREYASSGEARREAQALDVLLAEAKTPQARRELHARLADVHEHKLGAAGTALDVVLRGVREFPQDIELWDRADSLAALAGRPTELAEAFREALRGSMPDDVESELCERAASLHEDKLGDPIGATPYLERVLAKNPGNERAFGRLKDILTAAERWGELEALYDRASAATDDVARKIDMLVEVALVCEEIVEDVVKATTYYERIVELDGVHDGAIRALDRLYALQERHEDLAALLEGRLETAAGDDLLDFKLRIARLQLDRLHQPEKAMLHVEDVLRERVNDIDGRQLAEKLLEIGSQRARAARTLEVVYEARDEVRDLVRVLQIRLAVLEEPSGDPERSDAEREDELRDLLRRVSVLLDERLHDDAAALECVSKLVPLDPLDDGARSRLLDIGRRVGAHDRVADVLARAADRADTPGMKGEILMQVAAIHEDLLSNPRRAEETYRRVLELDDSDADLVLPAARALERIYSALGDSARLAEALRTQVRFESDGDKKSGLLGRLGELCQSVLDDKPGAIEAWRSRLEERPDDAVALAALDQLYASTEQWERLVEIVERRQDAVEAGAERRTLMTRRADLLATQLGNVADAIEAWRAVTDEFGPDEESLAALEGLYARGERWDELAETFEQHLDLSTDDAQRLALLSKLGDLRRTRQNDVAGSLEAYRQALGTDGGHEPSRAALRELLASEEPTARREAAEILHPIYEADGNHENLLGVLEIQVATAEDLDAKLDRLENAIRVAEGPLTDSARAFGYADRAVREAAGHTALAPWLDHLDRLASSSGKHEAHVAILRDVVGDIFDGEVQIEVTLKIAALCRDRLGDRDLSREYFQKALELRPDDRTALLALESLYDEGGNAQNLLDILERRTDAAESDDERKVLLYRRGALLAKSLDERSRAIEVYQEILDLSVEAEAIAALEGLYAAEERWTDLVALHERQLEATPPDAPALRVKIAVVAARYLSDLSRAFDELAEALEADPQHAGAVAELERLLTDAPEAEGRARAAALLEPVYLVRADFSKVMNTLRARLDHAQDPADRRELLQRLAQLHEEQAEDYGAALETTAKLLHEDLGDESTVAELERLAKVAGAEKRLAEIYAGELEAVMGDDENSARLARRAGELFADLADLERALVYYRRALAFEPDSRPLFEAIDGLLTRTARHEERVALYRDGLEHRFEPSERLALLHVIALLQRSELGLPDEAIETYRSALDADENDVTSLDALTDLYAERERWADLSELHLRRAEAAGSPAVAAPFRLALARLCRERLGDTARAIDQLEEIVRDVRDHREAIKELEGLLGDDGFKERVVEVLRPIYEEADDWRHLIRLNEDRFALAEDPHQKVSVLRETAQLWESRGNDPEKAHRALGLALELDAEDPDTRGEYERLTEAIGAWDALAELYEKALTNESLGSRRDVLATLASVHDARRDDPRRALEAYLRLHELDPSELAPIEKMEQLATLLSDWGALVRVLLAKIDVTLEDEERASIWRRVGEARRDMLEDHDGAVEAYERALDLDQESAWTVDCLIDLYESREQAERLVELYQRRVDLTDEDDADLKYTLLIGAADVYEKKLADRAKAIDALGQALAARPGDGGVIASLNRLYRGEGMWPELLENLKLQASTAEEPARRAEIRREIGEILAGKMQSFEDALEAYRLVLDEAPEDEVALGAVRSLGEDHEDLRDMVAGILVPVLRQAARHDALVDALEMRLSVESEPTQRAETLRTIAEVLETHLSRPGDALGAALRALTETPERGDLHSDIERLAGLSEGWARYADALGERAQSTFDPEVGKDLYSRLGRVAEEHLKDEKRAVEAYTRAVEQAGDQPLLLEALDRLYERLGDAQALSEILDRRAAVETSDGEQAQIHYRHAKLQIHEFKEPSRGLASLRMALERAMDHVEAADELEKLTDQRDLFEEAAEILESVYRARAQTDRLASLYEKRVGFAESAGERIDMRRNLARVLESEVKDAAAAQRVLQQGLADDPSDGALLDEIERLAGMTGNWAAAAESLQSAVDSKAELLPDAARDLSVRVAVWYRDRVQDPALAEKALGRALEFDPASDEVLVQVEQLQRSGGRERDLIATLRRRAKLQPSDESRDDLYRGAKALADGIGDAELGEAILRELLATDDTNLWALAELTTLREAAQDWRETFDLLVKRSELRAQGDTVSQLRHRAASIAREHLKEPARAVELYEHLFEDSPGDTVASTALRDLFAETERWKDLGGLLERLVDLSDAPAARGTLRMELAKLNQDRFGLPDVAIDLLRGVLEEEPQRAEAVVALSQLYEANGRDEELAELLTQQIAAASGRGDVEAEKTFQVRLGEVYESRLGNKPKAIATYQAVLERDASHRGALEALARLHLASDQVPEAARALDRLLDATSGADAVKLSMELADLHQKLGDSGSVSAALERGLTHDPRHDELRTRLKASYTATAAWEKLAGLLAADAEAVDDVDEKVRLYREGAKIHGTKRADHAAEAGLLEKASELRPDDRDLLLQLCDAYSSSGRGKAAAEVLEKIVESYGGKRSKELGEIHRRLANAYLADGDRDRALDELDKAFRIEPGNVATLKRLGEVALEKGDLKKAQQMFRALLLQKLEDDAPITKAEVFFHLGEVHQGLGEKSKAIQMLERALQTDPALTKAQTKLDEIKG